MAAQCSLDTASPSTAVVVFTGMGRPFFSLGSLLALGSLAGCVAYDPALVQRDASPDMGGNGTCTPHHAPGRPAGDDTSMAGDVSFGLRDVVLNQSAALARMTGYDLDDFCTDDTNHASECNPGMGGRVPTDGDDGIDNQFGAALYPIVEAAVPGLEMRARAAQTAGNGLPVLRLRGWNGTMNDPVVDVTITAAVFSTMGTGLTMAPAVTIADPAHQTLADGSPVPPPVWDGQDFAWVRNDSFLGGDLDMPLVRDQQAYVNDGLVVAHLPARVDITFPTDTVGVLVRLTDAVATGQLSEDGLMLTNVIVAGRWAINDLLTTAENIGLCRGSGQYSVLNNTLIRDGDVRSTPPMPGDPVLDCDALSIGVSFTGFRMRIAGITPGLVISDQCASEAGVPDGSTAMDAGIDAGDDGGSDGGEDAGMDAFTPSVDANTDTTIDTTIDSH